MPDFQKCGNCDLCLNPRDTIEATEAGQKFVSAVYRTGQSFGVAHIVDILTGKKTNKIEQLLHDQLPTFGVGKEYGINEWKTIARQLMARGFILSDMEFGSLKISEQGFILLKGQNKFSYRPDIKFKTNKNKGSSRTRQVVSELSDEDQDLYLKLKGFRKEIAAERSVPAYIIFSDKSLIDMAVQKPTTLDQFGEIFGVGAGKKKEFGSQFTAFIGEN